MITKIKINPYLIMIILIIKIARGIIIYTIKMHDRNYVLQDIRVALIVIESIRMVNKMT